MSQSDHRLHSYIFGIISSVASFNITVVLYNGKQMDVAMENKWVLEKPS